MEELMISWSRVCQVALDTIGPSARYRKHKVSYKQAPNYLAVLERWRWHICLLHLIPPQEHGIYQPSIDPTINGSIHPTSELYSPSTDPS